LSVQHTHKPKTSMHITHTYIQQLHDIIE